MYGVEEQGRVRPLRFALKWSFVPLALLAWSIVLFVTADKDDGVPIGAGIVLALVEVLALPWSLPVFFALERGNVPLPVSFTAALVGSLLNLYLLGHARRRLGRTPTSQR